MNYLKSLKKWFKCAAPFVLLLLVLIFPISSPTQSLEPARMPAVEWLKFQVPPPQQARFIEQDAAIWTPVLASYPGFQDKEIWTSPTIPDELIIVTHWASFDQWHAIPKGVLERTTQRFHEAMGVKYAPEAKGFRLAWSSRF